jgi:hypothetical protein
MRSNNKVYRWTGSQAQDKTHDTQCSEKQTPAVNLPRSTFLVCSPVTITAPKPVLRLSRLVIFAKFPIWFDNAVPSAYTSVKPMYPRTSGCITSYRQQCTSGRHFCVPSSTQLVVDRLVKARTNQKRRPSLGLAHLPLLPPCPSARPTMFPAASLRAIPDLLN